MTEEKIQHLIEINKDKRVHRKSRHVTLELLDQCPKCGLKGQLTAHLLKPQNTWCFNCFSIIHGKYKDGKHIRWHCWIGKTLTNYVPERIIGPMAHCSKCNKWKSIIHFYKLKNGKITSHCKSCNRKYYYNNKDSKK